MFNFFGFGKNKNKTDDFAGVAPISPPTVRAKTVNFEEALALQIEAKASQSATNLEVTESKNNPKFSEDAISDKLVAKSADSAPSPADESASSTSVTPITIPQLNSVRTTREDVIAAYKIFLGRMPENMDVVENRIGLIPEVMMVEFMLCKELSLIHI